MENNKYVIVDIDGTIANCSERAEKYLKKGEEDWDGFYDSCAGDKPIYPIIELVKNLAKSYKIVFATGRRETCRADTIEWITKYFGECDLKMPPLILMRENGDKRHDTLVKPIILKTFFDFVGLNMSDIAFILEDRDSMVAKWREMGYTCLQVADGNFQKRYKCSIQ